ncbi:MAG: Sugar or nucleoside kinase, ribokinase family [Verrucomicrobiaceae bacterium]|nr:Sugar or nucleoside kinase, ribokinase family [Verrucomicrobiaceae bacterium]
MTRNGILGGGNFIIDYVKTIDAYPQQDMLCNILRETSANGGGPYNVLKDLAAMQAPFPLEAAGLVGTDANGGWILRDCTAAGIDPRQLQQTPKAPTSYTDAMTVESTGRRTFFHQRGANALLGAQHFDFSATTAKLFHLGYLMLLDEMDRLLPDGRSVASLVLENARKAGLLTTVDIVSTENPQFREIAEAALPFTDYLIINEIEAGKVAGLDLRPDDRVDVNACAEAARRLLAKGVSTQVVIHFVDGAVVADNKGGITIQGSLLLPEGFIVGATGAGDAFAAGYLFGIHEGLSISASVELAVCSAAACLTHPTPSLGLRPVSECFQLASKHGRRAI